MTPRDRYPGFDVLTQRGHWDETTREVVLDRLYNVPPFRHLTPSEQATLKALCDQVIPQADRPPDRHVPLAPWIDLAMEQSSLGGFRFEDMPPNDVAWRQGLAGLDQTARILCGRAFAELSDADRDRVLEVIRAGQPPGEVWTQMPAQRWWIYVALNQISGVYYAHPFAWDEIGFGGPAYPRGYFALNHGAREPWEADEAPNDAGDSR
jgi:hypothetical protein